MHHRHVANRDTIGLMTGHQTAQSVPVKSDSRNRLVRSFCGCVVLLLAVLAPVWAADEPDAATPLFRYVPDEMAAVLVVKEIPSHLDAARGSSAAQYLESLPFLQNWQSRREFQQLATMEKLLPLYFGLTIERITQDLFGGAIVLAFRPAGYPSPTTTEAGLVLIRAKNPATLPFLLERLRDYPGGAQMSSKDHNGIPYFARKEPNGRVVYLALVDQIGLLTDQESLLIDALSRRQEPSKWATLAERIRPQLPARTLLELIIQPDALQFFGETLGKLPDAKDPLERLVASKTGFVVEQLDWLAVTVVGRDRDGFSLRIQAAIPRFTATGPLRPLPACIGEDECLAWCRLELDWDMVTEIARLWHQSLPTFEQRQLEQLLTFTLPGIVGSGGTPALLAPGGWLLIRAVANAELPRLEALLGLPLAAIQVEEGWPSLPDQIEQALRPWLFIFSLESNRNKKETWRPVAEQRRGQRIFAMTDSQAFGAAFEPAYAVVRGSSGRDLLVGGTTRAVLAWGFDRLAIPALPSAKPVASESSSDVLAVVWPRRVSQWFTAHRTNWSEQARSNPGWLANADDREQLERFLAVAGMFTTVQLIRNHGPGQLAWELRLTAAP